MHYSLENLEDILLQTTSQEPEILKKAEEHLMQCQHTEGFFLRLAEYFMDTRRSEMLRWSAVLFFKNHIELRLQIRSKMYLKGEEMSGLKNILLCHFQHPPSQLSDQIAMVISRVVRVEFRQWPSFLPSIISVFHHSKAPELDHGLLMLACSVKALWSRRLAPDKAAFAQLCKELLPLIGKVWQRCCEELNQSLHPSSPSSTNPHTNSQASTFHTHLNRCLLTVKIVRVLVRGGGDENDAVTLNILQSLPAFHIIGQDLKDERSVSLNNKLLNSLSKFLLERLEKGCHFIMQHLLSSILTISFQQSQDLSERVLVNLLNAIKYTIQHQLTTSSGDMMLEEGIISDMIQPLLINHLTYSTHELNLWSDDEEAFISDELGDSEDVCLRACVEGLLGVLLKNNESVLCVVVASLLQQCQQVNEKSPMQDILFKDMAYNACGLCMERVGEWVDFRRLLLNQLIPDLQTTSPDYRIVRRRVVWLMGRGMCEETTLIQQQQLYTLITPTPSNDLPTQFEAVRTLRLTLENYLFDASVYQTYVERHLVWLAGLMNHFHHASIKKEVLITIDSIVACMEADKHVVLLKSLLPHLWSHTPPHLLPRVVASITCVVQKLGAESSSLYEWLLPLVAEVTQVRRKDCLWEDGVLLWLSVIRSCPTLTQPLLLLFRNMPPLLEHATEALQTLIEIMRSYLILDSNAFLQMWYLELQTSVEMVMREVSDDGVIIILKFLSLMMHLCPEATHALFQQQLNKTAIIVANINIDLGNKNGTLISAHVVLWSRFILHHPNLPSILPSILTNLASLTHKPVEEMMDRLMDGWGECYEHLSNHIHLKLSSLAMLKIASLPINMSSFWNSVLSVCVDVLHRVCIQNGNHYEDPLLLTVNESEVFDGDDVDDSCLHWKHRTQQLGSTDVVLMSSLTEVVEEGWRRGDGQIEYEVLQQLQHILAK